MISKGIIYFIKRELLITALIGIIFGVSFYLYQSQKNFNKKQEIVSLKQSIESEKETLREEIKKYNKEKEFEQKIRNLKIIGKPSTLDIYKTADKLTDKFYEFFGEKSIVFSYKPVRLRVNGIQKHVFYKVVMEIPYTNVYQILSFFNYLKKKYFYIVSKVYYNTNNQVFKIKIYLLGKKGKMRRRRRFYY